MAERKVLVKYYPPDFDPSKLPKTKKPKNNQQDVRLMLPMSIQCKGCGEYIHKGKKFNGRKEEVVGEMYLTIKIYRLYFRCPTCLNEITFKTDPKNSDYTVERGASRNFEPWKQATREEKLEKEKKEREEMGDNMKVLENRSEQSKREMAIQDAIEEQRERNARVAGITTDALLDIHIGIAAQLEEDQIEKAALEAFANKNNRSNGSVKSVTLPDPTFDPSSSSSFASTAAASASSFAPSSSSSLPILKRLPDPVDFTRDDDASSSATPFSRGSNVDLLAGVIEEELGDSNDTDTQMSEQTTGSASTAAASSLSSTSAAAASTAAAPSAATSTSAAILPGMVLLKKRKKTDEEKAQRKKEKKQKLHEAVANATPPAPVSTTESGLGGLLGNYDSD